MIMLSLVHSCFLSDFVSLFMSAWVVLTESEWMKFVKICCNDSAGW